MSEDKRFARHNSARGTAAKGRRKGPAGQPKGHSGQRNKDWRREYYIPDYSIQRAARDLLSHSITEEIEDFAGRMFALQDLLDDEDLENISAVEKESNSPLFLAIAAALRQKARTDDPEYARPDPRQHDKDSRATEEIDGR